MRDASPAAALVLAACHSLVAVEGKLAGDPIEVAALEGVGWTYDAEAETAKPVGDSVVAVVEAEPSSGSAPMESAGQKSKASVESVKILQRFHFASHLQRMAVVADVTLKDGAVGIDGSGRYALVKGSPEAVGRLLAKGAAPAWYDKALCVYIIATYMYIYIYMYNSSRKRPDVFLRFPSERQSRS